MSILGYFISYFLVANKLPTSSSPTGGQVGNSSVDSAKPSTKIQESPSADKSSKEYKKEVEEHNKEFEQGHDRANAAGEDKVDKKFWEGEFSVLEDI